MEIQNNNIKIQILGMTFKHTIKGYLHIPSLDFRTDDFCLEGHRRVGIFQSSVFPP